MKMGKWREQGLELAKGKRPNDWPDGTFYVKSYLAAISLTRTTAT